MIAFPLIISVILHADLWKLAPYFKKKKEKKRVCYSIVCYKRTIDCGMQFKDDICQQMPCSHGTAVIKICFSFGNKSSL